MADLHLKRNAAHSGGCNDPLVALVANVAELKFAQNKVVV